MLLIELLSERVSRDFVEARYGYWIEPDGKIDPINLHAGHAEFLSHKFPKIPYDAGTDNERLYETALGLGWIRIAADRSADEMAIQWYKLNNRSASSLVDLINTLDEKRFYFFENVRANFHTKRDAVAQVRRALQYQTSGMSGQGAGALDK